MPIYTRRGDCGETDLLGKRVKKSHPRLHAIGMVDEVMVLLGELMSRLEEERMEISDLEIIYQKFFIIQTMIADVKGTFGFQITDRDVAWLEEKIDGFERQLRPLKQFIYYTGHKLANLSQRIRVKIRAVERYLVEMNEKESIDPFLLSYVNRCSDYFYCWARYLNKRYGYEEKQIKL